MSLQGKCRWDKNNSGCVRGFYVQNSCYGLFVINLPLPPSPTTERVNFADRSPLFSYRTPPLPTTEGLNFALWPHPNWPAMSGHTSAGKLPSKSGCRCTLLAGNSSNSLARSKEQINFSQQSPKMFKMASESFIHALLSFLGLFLHISLWVPLNRYWYPYQAIEKCFYCLARR